MASLKKMRVTSSFASNTFLSVHPSVVVMSHSPSFGPVGNVHEVVGAAVGLVVGAWLGDLVGEGVTTGAAVGNSEGDIVGAPVVGV